MPDSTTITETATAAVGSANLTADSPRNSASDWPEGSLSPKNDHDGTGEPDNVELKEPLIPRIFPVYAFI